MMVEGRTHLLNIPALQRIQQPLMRVVCLDGVGGVYHASQLAGAQDDEPEDVEDLEQDQVVDIHVERFVEGTIVLRRVTASVRLAFHPADDLSQDVQLLQRNLLDNALDHSVLKVGACLQNVEHALYVEQQPIGQVIDDRVEAKVFDKEAGPGPRLDDPEDLERFHGLAHGVATDVELPRQLTLGGKGIARLQLVIDDIALNLVMDLVEKRRPFERLKLRSRSALGLISHVALASRHVALPAQRVRPLSLELVLQPNNPAA